jgi:hypothetical protein
MKNYVETFNNLATEFHGNLEEKFFKIREDNEWDHRQEFYMALMWGWSGERKIEHLEGIDIYV